MWEKEGPGIYKVTANVSEEKRAESRRQADELGRKLDEFERQEKERKKKEKKKNGVA